MFCIGLLLEFSPESKIDLEIEDKFKALCQIKLKNA